METLSFSSPFKRSYPPPSPEGELMETIANVLDIRRINICNPPPSPEGELMETWYDVNFLKLHLHPPRLRLKEN